MDSALPAHSLLSALNWDQLDQQLINGLQVGAIYALIALGYTMVYGVLRLINFAHGEVYMIGAYVAYYTTERWFDKGKLPSFVLLLLALVLAMAICASLGVLIERIAYRPLRNHSRIAVLITAIGVSLLLQQGGLLIVKTSPQPTIGEDVNPFKTIHLKDLPLFGDLTISGGQMVMFFVSLVLMGALWYLVTRTATGRGMRAVAHDFSTAALMGVDVNRIVAITFIVGSALAGAGGMMNATALGTPLDTFYGLLPGVKAFVAAVLGGIGNIPGAVLGGFLMAIAEVLVVWAGFDEWKDAVAFVILILVLLFKPSGLLGKVGTEKV